MASVDVLVTASPAANDAMVPAVRRVLARKVESADTVTLTIEHDGPPAAPGQFQMLGLPGVGEVPISLSSAIDGALVHTIRAVGGVTRALCALEEGDLLLARGPYGTAWALGDDVQEGDVVVIAGGIGLAPLFPAIDALTTQAGLARGRRVVVYGARTPADRILRERLDALRARAAREPNLELHETVDAPTPDWSGHVGVVTQLLPRLGLDAARTRALVCGPEIMMRFAAQALAALGVPGARIQVSIERAMKCGVGVCGHCQCGPLLACRNGPVTTYPQVERLWSIRGL